MRDLPPLGPDDLPSPEAFRRLARALLRELARYDPAMAERLRREGLAPDEPAAKSGADPSAGSETSA